MNHKQFLAEVRRVAELNGYLVYFTYRSTRSPAGFPDLVFARDEPPDFLIAELKVGADRLTWEQEEWIAVLGAAGVDTYVWRPDDIDAIIARLARPRTRRRVYRA